MKVNLHTSFFDVKSIKPFFEWYLKSNKRLDNRNVEEYDKYKQKGNYDKGGEILFAQWVQIRTYPDFDDCCNDEQN